MLLFTLQGKWGQRSGMTQTFVTSKPDVLYNMLASSTVTVKNAYLINEESVMIHYKEQDDFVQVSYFSNDACWFD